MNKNLKKYKKALDSISVDNKLKEKTLKQLVDLDDKNGSKYTLYKKVTYSLSTVLAGVLLIFPMFLYSNNFLQNKRAEQLEDTNEILYIEEKDILPKVGTIENLNSLLSSLNEERLSENEDILSESQEYISMDSAKNDIDYSKTNIQVEGVDEADIVKTNGEYIYYIANSKLYVVNVKNPNNIKIENTLEFEENLCPMEMYLKENKLVLVLERSEIYTNIYNNRIMYDVAYADTETLVIFYDIRGNNNLVERRRIEVEGAYTNSRLIGENLYFLSTKYLYNKDEDLVPEYLDTVISNEKQKVDVEKMLYVPDSNNTSYLTIVSVNINENKKANIKTVLGAGNEIYCTDSNLYITYTKYNGDTRDYSTNIYKFKLIDTNIISNATAIIAGRPLNQFSMNEYNNNFIIVTTNEYWVGNDINNKNDLYVLDENLKEIGKLENFSRNENLEAVRFMGDKAYVVTFERTDPLFVIDISEPTEPRILGKLEIPGYSSYLHPYDETHIIGIGQDVEIEDTKYGEIEVVKGVKVSLFDVSDFNNPKEIDSLIIGEKAYTDVQYNHKAVLFSKDKNLLAFPISNNVDGKIKNQYLVLSVGLENGITLEESIEHGEINEENRTYSTKINRGLYIKDCLYTLSNKKIEVMKLNTFNKISEIELK